MCWRSTGSERIATLDKAGLLYQVVAKFADIDLHPDVVPNHAMGYISEELLRRFSEMQNETAGEHFTPREVIKAMTGSKPSSPCRISCSTTQGSTPAQLEGRYQYGSLPLVLV